MRNVFPLKNTFNLLKERLNYINQGVKVISTNMENIRTPDFKEKELVPFEKLVRTSSSMNLKITHPAHFQASTMRKDAYVQESGEQEYTYAGNNVNLQTQLRNANQINSDHLQMTHLYRTASEIIGSALIHTR